MLGRHSNLTVFLHALGQASVPDPHKNSTPTGDVERTYDPSMRRVEAGESGIQGQPGLQSETSSQRNNRNGPVYAKVHNYSKEIPCIQGAFVPFYRSRHPT